MFNVQWGDARNSMCIKTCKKFEGAKGRGLFQGPCLLNKWMNAIYRNHMEISRLLWGNFKISKC
jgi:hypothetical protein